MIKVVLLSVTLLLVNSKQPRKQLLILEDVMKKLNASIPEDLQNEWVPDIFEMGKCSKMYFCQVQAALKEINHEFMKKWNIIRVLQVYHNVTACPPYETGVELQLKHLLIKAHRCAQQIYSKP